MIGEHKGSVKYPENASIVQLAEELGASVTSVEDITRANAAGSDLPQGGLSDIFGGKLGHVAVLNSQDEQSRFLVAVTSVTPAPALEPSSEQDVQKERLSGNLSENLLSQYIGQIQSEEGIEINQQLLQAVLQPQNNPVHSN